MVTGYIGLQKVTRGYIYRVTEVYIRLQKVTEGYKGLYRATEGYVGLQGVT